MADGLNFKSEHAGKIQGEMVDLAAMVDAVKSEMETIFDEYYGCWGKGETGRVIANGENNDGLIAGFKSQVAFLAGAADFANGPDGWGPTYGKAEKKLLATEAHNREVIAYNEAVKAFNEQARNPSRSAAELERDRQALERRGETLKSAGMLRK
ncbi:hypothetical protein AB0B25_09545 [Nocardia sp. NPDC049190]|uniref:hypothetical protein n=1 Tax=unclassified Nocardia TaxID=2637762 RepID=UPI0033C90FE7